MKQEQLVLTEHDYVDYLRHAPAGSYFYYKKDNKIGFNVRTIKEVMQTMGVEVFYVGDSSHLGTHIHQIKILSNSITIEELEKINAPKFFDPKNLI